MYVGSSDILPYYYRYNTLVSDYYCISRQSGGEQFRQLVTRSYLQVRTTDASFTTTTYQRHHVCTAFPIP